MLPQPAVFLLDYPLAIGYIMLNGGFLPLNPLLPLFSLAELLMHPIYGLSLAALLALAAVPGRGAGLSAPVRVMTWNIRFDNPADGPDAWPLRREFVQSLLRYHRPEVIGIQEGLIHQVREIAAGLDGYAWCGGGRDDGREAGELCAVFYDSARFDPLENGTFWLSPTPERPSRGWDAELNRICTWARLRDRRTGARFCVFNTHLDHRGVAAREESARLLRERIGFLAGDDPALLIGDFNARPEEAPHAVLTAPQGSGPALCDAWVAPERGRHGPSATFSGFDATRGIVGHRIDWILVCSNVRVLRHAILTDFRDGARFPSDHLPVVADVVLP